MSSGTFVMKHSLVTTREVLKNTASLTYSYTDTPTTNTNIISITTSTMENSICTK